MAARIAAAGSLTASDSGARSSGTSFSAGTSTSNTLLPYSMPTIMAHPSRVRIASYHCPPGVQCRQPAGVAGLPSFVTIAAENAPIAAQRRCQRSGRMPIEIQPVFSGDLAMWTLDQHAVPHIQTPLPGPRAQKLLDRDARFVSPSYTRCYPLVVARGSGAVIEDVDGNRFLDMTAGIAVTATGHCHPDVVAAIQDQAAKLIHMSGTDFYYEPQIDLAQRLAESAPGPSPKRVFFTNSGAEALEAALKLARWHTGRSRVIAFLGAFHGRTYGAMSLSGSKLVHRRGFSPLVPDIHHVPFPRDCRACGEDAGCACVRQIEETVFKRTAPPDEV